MVSFTDSQEVSATIATVSLSTIGTINVPKGRTYLLTNIWFGSAQKGIGIISVDIFPSMIGRYVFNTDSAIETANESMGWPLNVGIAGPATITLSTEQAAATSNLVRSQINYIDTTGA
jgi:hypothetical protein